jgi:hypothetical protein
MAVDYNSLFFSLVWKPLWYWSAGKAAKQYQSGLRGCIFVAWAA